MGLPYRDVIDENCFHNCVRESEKALLVLGHECGSGLNNTVDKAYIKFNIIINNSCLHTTNL